MSPQILEWKPLPKQEEFIRLPFTIDEALFGGAAGPGKSELLVLLPLIYEFYRFPGFKGIIFRRTHKEIDQEIAIRAQKYYPRTGGKYNSTNRRWFWPDYDSYIFFGHCKEEQDIRNYDSAEYQYIAFDELTHFTEFQYTYMFSRSRSTIEGLPAIIRNATNPGNIGHGWVRRRFVEPYRVGEETSVQGGSILFDTVTKMKRMYIHARNEDNPYLDDQYKIKLESMSDEADKRAKLYGDWWTFTGQVFDNWRIQPFPGEPDNAQHVIEPFDVPFWWPRVLSIDWGYTALLWAGWGALSPEGRVYVYREFAAKKMDTEEWAMEINSLSHGEIFEDVVLDWNCFENRGEDQTIAEKFADYSKLDPRPADKGPGSRISGQKLIKEYLRWRPLDITPRAAYSPDIANHLLEEKGIDAYKEYLEGFKPQKIETVLPKVQVFNTCTYLIDVIPECVYDKDKVEDVAEFDGDDPYDGFRYMLRSFKRLLDKASNTAKKLQEKKKLAQLAEKDQTSFQHLAPRLSKGIKPIRMGTSRGRKPRLPGTAPSIHRGFPLRTRSSRAILKR